MTHTKRDPWERPGGTTFHFVNDGIDSALRQARAAPGDRDVRVAGGGAMMFGTGIRLFEGVDASRVALQPVAAESSTRVTHLTYAVGKR
ncbi:MAG TPA: hypothetical protein VHF06_06300 [Pseudonocardiaceae bacterium]|nr:hypothetical protein [Pseudonocardiaceae bacterium]